MFIELMPIVAERTLMITVSKLKGSDGKLQVNIVPKHFELNTNKVGYDKELEDAKKQLETAAKGLDTPLTLVGTPEEIDAELATSLAQYVEKQAQVKSTVQEALAELEKAYQAAQEAKKAKGAKKPEPKKAEAKKPESKKDDKKRPAGTAQAPDKFTLFQTADEANAAAAPKAVSADDIANYGGEPPSIEKGGLGEGIFEPSCCATPVEMPNDVVTDVPADDIPFEETT